MNRPLDEQYDTQKEVELDPCGAHEAIQTLADRLRDMRALAKKAIELIPPTYPERGPFLDRWEQLSPWEGPGETCHHYSPDPMLMGDCRICGHTREAHE